MAMYCESRKENFSYYIDKYTLRYPSFPNSH